MFLLLNKITHVNYTLKTYTVKDVFKLIHEI